LFAPVIFGKNVVDSAETIRSPFYQLMASLLFAVISNAVLTLQYQSFVPDKTNKNQMEIHFKISVSKTDAVK